MPTGPAIAAAIRPVPQLADTEREAMLDLHCRHYANVSPRQFAADLADKHWVIELREGQGRLVGFSTLRVDAFPYQGRTLRVVFSGDTIVDPEARNTPALAASFGVFFTRLQDGDELYWLLICKGHRTYRFLPVFFHHFFPCCTGGGDSLRPLRDAIAQARFGPLFDPARGVLDLRGERDRLRPEDARVPDGHRRDPHTRFFLEANPGYLRGDELVCLAPLAPWNLRPAARRVIAGARTVWTDAHA